MGSPRNNFYNRKGYWKRNVRKADKKVIDILNREQREPKSVSISDYFVLGHILVNLGLAGEELASSAVKLGMTSIVMQDLSDTSNLLEMMSERLRSVAEAKWGQQLPTFPVYHTTMMATAELQDEADSIREMREIMGEA